MSIYMSTESEKTMEQLRLEGSHIYLRSITYEDTPLIVKWRAQDNVKRYFIYRGELTTEVHTNWMKTQVETGHVVQFIVCMKENDRPVGSVYLRDINKDEMKAEYGVFLGEENIRGHGVGSEALQMVLDYAFNVMRLNLVYARALSDNAASIGHFISCGFVREKYLEKNVLLDGEYRDVVILAKRRDDCKM